MSKLKDFRPISLSNVSYKRITKILSHKLRSLMEKLVNPCQCSFPPNRQSRDNIIIAQEVFHSMRNKKGATGWMEIKIDLEKAYECRTRQFLTDTPSHITFADIWNCIHPLKGKCFGMIRLLKNLSL